ARIALGGVATRPWRALEAEKALIGQKASMEVFERAADQAMAGARAFEHNGYKIPLGKQAVIRNLRDLSA
ncbi:MAG TPA: xanthine dehydrogenase family protein subunit M, partial [Pseudomonas sp.]|nr:xanthine dehydrogenase family protein subunit M [Pseudomonas sp.]